jgi:hypothetical protein
MKAGWGAPNIRYDDTCTGGASLMVLVNSQAAEGTRNAATLLGTQLAGTLPGLPRQAIPTAPTFCTFRL